MERQGRWVMVRMGNVIAAVEFPTEEEAEAYVQVAVEMGRRIAQSVWN